MTKNEARQCVMDNYHIVTEGCDLGLCGRDKDADAFEEAIDILLDAPSIAQSIRDSAIDNAAFALGVLSVDWLIIDAFIDNSDSIKDDNLQYRTFMLLVAEALE